MPRKLRDESTPEGRAIWADVDKAASRGGQHTGPTSTYRALSEEVVRLRNERDALREALTSVESLCRRIFGCQGWREAQAGDPANDCTQWLGTWLTAIHDKARAALARKEI